MSVAAAFLNSKNFAKLLIKGKDQSYLTPEEINDAIPASIIEPDALDEIMNQIHEARIDVQDDSKEEEEEGIRLDGTEIIEEALTKKEKAELKSASTDPVKLYLKRMGSVALLTREGEVEIAKEIEEGEREIILSSLAHPTLFAKLLSSKRKSNHKKINLSLSKNSSVVLMTILLKPTSRNSKLQFIKFVMT